MQHFLFESMYNARGYKCFLKDSDINEIMLIRSDNTAYATVSDMATLKKLGIKSIIDIRSDKEKKEEPDILSNNLFFSYHFIPFDADNFAYYLSRNPKMLKTNLLEGYILLLNQRETVKRIIEEIAIAMKHGGVLFHCSGGKDRTGIISMLLQELLGINRKTIIQDYHETYYNLRKSNQINAWVAKFGEEYIYCNPSLMESTIQYIENNFCSIQNYLVTCGVSYDCINFISSVKIIK